MQVLPFQGMGYSYFQTCYPIFPNILPHISKHITPNYARVTIPVLMVNLIFVMHLVILHTMIWCWSIAITSELHYSRIGNNNKLGEYFIPVNSTGVYNFICISIFDTFFLISGVKGITCTMIHAKKFPITK